MYVSLLDTNVRLRFRRLYCANGATQLNELQQTQVLGILLNVRIYVTLLCKE